MAIINQSPASQATLGLTIDNVYSMTLGANDPTFSELFYEYNISPNGATLTMSLPLAPRLPSDGQIWPLGLV